MNLFLQNSINQLKTKKSLGKISFFLIGVLSTIWFLIRVIPKPQRATYPCMRAAAPFMSSFVIYIASICGASILLKRFPKGFKAVQLSLTALFFVAALSIPAISTINEKKALLNAPALEEPNSPMGNAQGINPGRVVWVWNPDATDENLPLDKYGKGAKYYMDKYTNQDEVDKMLVAAVTKLTDESSVKEAWDEIFKYHNQKRGKGAVSYKAGEIVFLKINRTSSWGGNFDRNSLERVTTNSNYGICETSPQLVTSVLRHLVNEVGVAQENIVIGDPMKHIYESDYDKWHTEFPNITYLDVDRSSLGRTQVVKSSTAKIDYSDRGEVLREGDWNSALTGKAIQTDNLYTIFEEMEYMINLPTMKSHKHGGVTMFAKNHFGSHTRGDAKHLHGGLVKMYNDPIRNQYGMYRVLTDIMGHELLGGKNLVYLMDALYSSDMEVTQPNKYQKAPWNNDWTSSIFISQDPVAIESVGFDILYYEYDGTNGYEEFPHYGAVDDYLHQAADKANWPEGIIYDPENDGTEIPSLGVHEHWNNPTDMQYSRNLGTGEGIELVKVTRDDLTASQLLAITDDTQLSVYPNPVENNANIQYTLKKTSKVSTRIVSVNGSVVYQFDDQYQLAGKHESAFNASSLIKGIYFVQLIVDSNNQIHTTSFRFEKK